jgi:hypothetical protein
MQRAIACASGGQSPALRLLRCSRTLDTQTGAASICQIQCNLLAQELGTLRIHPRTGGHADHDYILRVASSCETNLQVDTRRPTMAPQLS